MKFSNVPTPEVYKSSADFRFFLRWTELCLSQLQFDTENIVDLLDPERCPASLLWMLGDTKGYKYDDRVSVAFNRLVILYFMSLIRNRGCKTGITLAAELNLAQFNLNDYAHENPAYEDRIADTSIPVNSVYVTSHNEEGYVDIVYFSENIPTDVCLEYVRPIGMYCFTHSGVRVDSRTKISVDARLTNKNDLNLPIGPTHVGHYRRADYASMQRMVNDEGRPDKQKRHQVYYRNSDYEKSTTALIDPGYRTLYSLQICNNEHIVKALLPSTGEEIDPIFSPGFGPQNVNVTYPDSYLKHSDYPEFNLRYDRNLEESITPDVYTVDADRTRDILNPRPAVNPVMGRMGEAMSMAADNSKYTIYDAEEKKFKVVDASYFDPESSEGDEGDG